MGALGSTVGRGDVGTYAAVSLEYERVLSPFMSASVGVTLGPALGFETAAPGGTATGRVYFMGKAPGGLYLGLRGWWWVLQVTQSPVFGVEARVLASHTYHGLLGYRFSLGPHFALSVEGFVGPGFEAETGVNGGLTAGAGFAF